MDEKNAEQLKVRTRAAFDAQAATYDAGMEGEHARRLYPHVLGEVRAAVAGLAAPRLLDLGCGTGALAERVLGVAPGAHLTCVDLSPRMAEAARARLAGRAEVLLGDAERLPFHDAGFDAAWCNDTCHHYPGYPGRLVRRGELAPRRDDRLRRRGAQGPLSRARAVRKLMQSHVFVARSVAFNELSGASSLKVTLSAART